MDETIERNELKKENPAPLAEENTVDAAPEAVPAADENAPAAEQELTVSEEAVQEEAPADKADGTAPAEGAEIPAEAEAEKDAENDAPLVMPAPAENESFVMPEKPVPAPVPAGPAEKLFNGLSYIGLPLLLIFAAAMSFLEVWQVRELWCSDEVRLAETLMSVKNGDWLVLTMNGQPCTDTPPLYFWFMDALTRIPGLPISVPMALFLAVAVSHALFIGSIWLLARGTGFDRRVAFASGLVALSCVFISGAALSPRTDLLFAALVTLGMTCLYRGWIKSFAPFWLAFGWLLLAAATLTKSPLGIAFAIAASVLFLFWRCTPGRLNSRDGLPGFFLMLLVLAGWMGILYLDGHTSYIRAMVEDQLGGRVLKGGSFADIWWYYLAALPVIWAPWILLPLFVNWLSALRGIPAAVRARKTDGGSSWLWIWLVSGVAILSCVQTKAVIYALPLLAPLAVLTARSLLKLTAGRSRCFFGLTAAILAVAGLVLVLVDVYPFIKEHVPAEWMASVQAYIPACLLPWLDALEGTMYMGAALIVTAVVLLSLTRLALPGGALLITTLGMMLLFQPYHCFVVPSVTDLLCPRAQASVEAPAKAAEPAAPAESPVEAPKAAEPAAPAEAADVAPAEPVPAAPVPTEAAPAEAAVPEQAPAAPAEAPAEKAPEAQPEAAPAPEAEKPADAKA